MNFKISELIHSDTAVRYNINNMPDINALDCIMDLIVFCLQPLRDALKKPIMITNGYRSYALWKKLQEMGYNPSKTSMHLKGQAADIRVNGMSQESLFNFIRTSGVKYDQLIWEQDSNCIHISYVRCNNRQETLIRDKNFKYTKV